MHPASLCLFAPNTKCFSSKRMNWWNTNVIPLETQWKKNENMTLAFNFYRPVNFQAITQLPTLQSKWVQQLQNKPLHPLQGKGSLDSHRALQNSLPRVSQSRCNQTIPFLRDMFNFIRQIEVWGHRKRGNDTWQMSRTLGLYCRIMLFNVFSAAGL